MHLRHSGRLPLSGCASGRWYSFVDNDIHMWINMFSFVGIMDHPRGTHEWIVLFRRPWAARTYFQCFSGLADGYVPLQPVIEEDLDHFPRRYRCKFRRFVQGDLPLSIETHRIFRRPQGDELADGGRLVEPFASCQVACAPQQVLREAQTLDRVHFIPLRSLVSLRNTPPR